MVSIVKHAKLPENEGKEKNYAKTKKMFLINYVNNRKGAFLGYANRLLQNREDAEDVLQEFYTAIWTRGHSYDPKRNPQPWLYTVLNRQVIDFQRVRKRQERNARTQVGRVMVEDDLDEFGYSEANAIDSSDYADPVKMAEKSEEAKHIRYAVDQLDSRLKPVVDLVYFQGLIYREAAEILQIPLGTVKSRLHNVINKLEGIMEKGFSEPSEAIQLQSLVKALKTAA